MKNRAAMIWCKIGVRSSSGSVLMNDIPELDYAEFYDTFSEFLRRKSCHCLSYFGLPTERGLRFIALVGEDHSGSVYAASHICNHTDLRPSLTAQFPAMHSFEREIKENFGVGFPDAPFLKPLRYAQNRADQSANILNYPFYEIQGDSLHLVNVGPIHAGVIEPGVFRFICNGEEVIHLEIVLGFQHRGVERLMREGDNRLRQTLLAESIAGDSTVAHTTAFALAVEALGSNSVVGEVIRSSSAAFSWVATNATADSSLSSVEDSAASLSWVASATTDSSLSSVAAATSAHTINATSPHEVKPASQGSAERLELERAIAIELERVAVHIADTSALCADIGYQPGQVVCEALRTLVINSTQRWCGNRFGKGLIRPGGTNFPLTGEVSHYILGELKGVRKRYTDMTHNIETTLSVLSRFEDVGEIGRAQMVAVGAVGVAARASGLVRDIRLSYPARPYLMVEHRTVTELKGDIMSRLKVRMREVVQSIDYIERFISELDFGLTSARPDYCGKLAASSLSFSLVEGWRGEICHVAITDHGGEICHYKIKDPSMHNWLALALTVRGVGISEFPICNKSFSLSYAGHDL